MQCELPRTEIAWTDKLISSDPIRKHSYTQMANNRLSRCEADLLRRLHGVLTPQPRAPNTVGGGESKAQFREALSPRALHDHEWVRAPHITPTNPGCTEGQTGFGRPLTHCGMND